MNQTKKFGNAVLKLVFVCILGLLFQTVIFAVTPKSKANIEEQPGIVLYNWEEDDESERRR